jgi:YggT family protein
MSILVSVVDLLVRVLSLIVIIYVFLAYFMAPYHPIRVTFSRIVDPMLKPIRKLVPLIGMIDFSPFILLILIQILGRILIAMLRSIA